jgi:hypothetical protein
LPTKCIKSLINWLATVSKEQDEHMVIRTR